MAKKLKRSQLVKGKTYKAVNAKTGADIIGRLERVPVTAYVSQFTVKGKNLDPEFEGESEVDWDFQEPIIMETGEMQYVDSDAETVLESEMAFIEVKNG